MESLGISKEKLVKMRDWIIFALLFLWMVMPIIQTIRVVYKIVNLDEIYLILMKITGIVGIGIGALSVFDRIKNSENKKDTIKELLPIFIFVLYMIWTLIAALNSPYKRTAFQGNFYRKEGYYMYLNYAGYFFCAFLLKNKKLRKIILNTFIISSLYLIFATRITCGGEIFENIFTNMHIDAAVFAQFNHYGYYLMMTLMCSLGLFITENNKASKIAYIIAFTVIGYALIYNDTFGCYLATFVILIAYGIYSLIKKKDRKLICTAILIFTILSCITFKANENLAFKNIGTFANDIKTIVLKIAGIEIEGLDKDFEETGTTRMALWINGIKFMLNSPIIGYGPDNLRPMYAELKINQDRPHNLLIQLATTSGIPGMLLYVTAVGIIVVKGVMRLLKNNENGKIFLIIVATYLVSAMFGNSMYYTSPYFFITLGCLMNCNLNKKG